MSNNKGLFISFEGGEGSGKSTQIKLLAESLSGKGVESILTREPGGSEGGEEIRELLVKGEAGRWDGTTELLLLYAARNDHVQKIIKPAISEGKWVLSDRFADSTMAYQGYGHGLGVGKVNQVHDAALGGYQPDLTIIIDLPVETGLKRALARRDGEDRYESMDISFHERMRDGYLEIAENNPGRVKVIDGTGTIEDVQQLIISEIHQAFPDI